MEHNVHCNRSCVASRGNAISDMLLPPGKVAEGPQTLASWRRNRRYRRPVSVIRDLEDDI